MVILLILAAGVFWVACFGGLPEETARYVWGAGCSLLVLSIFAAQAAKDKAVRAERLFGQKAGDLRVQGSLDRVLKNMRRPPV